MRVGTYPTRNFATLGPFVYVTICELSTAATLASPPYRYGDRTISSPDDSGARRMVSEDSLNRAMISVSLYRRFPHVIHLSANF